MPRIEPATTVLEDTKLSLEEAATAYPASAADLTAARDSPPPSYETSIALEPKQPLPEEPAEEYDPWALTEWVDEGPKWSELTVKEKTKKVVITSLKGCAVLLLLYLFICSLDLLGAAFQLLGGRTAGAAFTSPLLQNPVCGLMIGVFVTVLLQSSSTSTSIIVTMVASGILPIDIAIYMVMGANIGTSVTNTLVAMGQVANKDEFRRAFGGATVHDMFNWLSVAVLLPLEWVSGYLSTLTSAMVENINPDTDTEEPQFLKVITKPLTDAIVRIDKNVLKYIAEEKPEKKRPLAKYWCKEVTVDFNETFPYGQLNQTYYDVIASDSPATIWTKNLKVEDFPSNVTEGTNYTLFSWQDVDQEASTTCTHWFTGVGLEGNMPEAGAGTLLLIFSILVLCACLIGMVKILSTLMQGPVASLIKKVINADFPGPLRHLTGYVAMLAGAGLTVLVQSSSVFTSSITPLVGIGVITLERVYPLTLGSNIGTTVTSILAALAGDNIKDALQISFVHLMFNISGILLFYPVPVMRNLPIRGAKFLGNTTADYRWFAIAYLFTVFFLLPALVFGLSAIDPWALFAACIIAVLVIGFIVVVNVSQSKCPGCLPVTLQTWDWLPVPLRSLEPYDRMFKKCCPCCKKCQEPNLEPSNLTSTLDGEIVETIVIGDEKNEHTKAAMANGNIEGVENKAFEDNERQSTPL